MIIIGITGMSGSGKSYVADLLKQSGIAVINADSVVHELYRNENPCTYLLRERFGDTIFLADHSIDRKALGKIVFSDPQKLALLNETVHPFVKETIRQFCRTAESEHQQAVVIDAPQLFESGLDRECTYIIAVIADHETRVRRIMKRDSVTREAALTRLSSQFSDTYFKNRANFIIDNSDNADLHTQLSSILFEMGLYS